jgi:hypothetical protein
VIEDLLARPAIQALLGRQDLATVVQRCADAANRQKNLAACQLADEANRLARIPLELRLLLARPAAAASIRELCLAAQVTPARDTYLCKELTTADLEFAALSKSAETARQQAEAQEKAAKDQAAMQDRQLGR